VIQVACKVGFGPCPPLDEHLADSWSQGACVDADGIRANRDITPPEHRLTFLSGDSLEFPFAGTAQLWIVREEEHAHGVTAHVWKVEP
jgi:hypothetical protein